MAAMEIDPAGQLHDCLDRYEMGDMGSLDQLQSYPGWSDALASGPGATDLPAFNHSFDLTTTPGARVRINCGGSRA